MWTSAGCVSPAVAGLGKAEEKGRVWPSIPGLPAALLWEDVGRCSRGVWDSSSHWGDGMGCGFIPEDKLDVIALKSRYSGD